MRWFLLAVALIFVGCSTKKIEPSLVKPDKRYLEALRYTQKCDIALSLENKALMIATYLNPLEKSDKERFLVRIYIDNDYEDQNRSGLNHPGYALRLNAQAPRKIISVKKHDKVLEDMPFKQPWYKFYIVEFKKSDSKDLTLTLSHKNYGSCSVTFENSSIY